MLRGHRAELASARGSHTGGLSTTSGGRLRWHHTGGIEAHAGHQPESEASQGARG